MIDTLRQVYARPTSGGVYYSANSVPTGSARLNALPNWDWTPQKTQWAGGGITTCMFAQALGCEPDTVDGRPWIKRLIHNPAQVNDMDVPDVYAGWPGNVLRHMIEQASTLPAGERVRCPDVQRPWRGVDLRVIDREVAKAYRIEPLHLRNHGRSAGEAKAVAAELAARWTGMTNRDIGAHYGGISGQAVYMIRQRLKSREINWRELERNLSRKCSVTA